MRSGDPVEEYLRGFPAYGKPLEELVPECDRRFYLGLPALTGYWIEVGAID